MNEVEFSQEAERVLYKIADTIEYFDTECAIDVDLHDGILNLETSYGTFVVNRQTPAKEIWLSSPISGPYHFSFKGEEWISRSGDNLFGVLSKELKITIEK